MILIDAKKARELAEEKQFEGFDIILKGIDEAARKGEFKYHYYGSINTAVCNKLTELGFKVSDSFNRNETLTTISWSL